MKQLYVLPDYFHYEMSTTTLTMVSLIPFFSPSGIVVCNFVLFLTTLMTIWCFYDVAGKHWVKLKKYQQSLKDREQVVIAQTVRPNKNISGYFS